MKKKIHNIHVFLGAADNKNYQALCSLIAAEQIISPKLDYMTNAPEEILAALSAVVDADDFVFVGQSIGGWYADQLSRQYHLPCILTNPCYYPHELELIAQSGIPMPFLAQYAALSAHDRNACAYVLCSDADTLIPDNIANCTALAQKVSTVSGSHSTIKDLPMHLHEMLAQIGAAEY